MNDDFPDLKIETMADGTGDGLILLEQSNGGNVDRVAIHPIHLRYMAEKCGLVATTDPMAQRTIATLSRRLCLLRNRIDQLGLTLLRNRIDHLSGSISNDDDSTIVASANECAYLADFAAQLTATADIAAEFCTELPHIAPENIPSSPPVDDAPPSSNP